MEVKSMEVSSAASEKTVAQEAVAKIDVPTLVGMALVLGLFGSIFHEAVGHGGMALLLGLHPRQVSTTFLDVSYVGVPDWQRRLVDAAGCATAIPVASLGLILIHLTRKSSNASLRFFLWLITTSSLLTTGGYMMVPTLLGFGDWESFVQGLQNPLLWKIVIILIGLVISLAGLYIGTRYLEPFAGRGPDRRKRRLTLIFTPYLTFGIVATSAAILNPMDPILILISGVAPSFGGNSWMLFILSLAHKPLKDTPEVPLTPTRDWLWIYAGIVSVLVEYIVLAPGLPR
jgi:hypothetical protein